MSLRPLIIDDEFLAAMGELKTYAEANPISNAVLHKILEGKAPPAGDNPFFVRQISFGYRIVYSIDEVGPGDWWRRASVSVPTANKLPNKVSVDEIVRTLGMNPEKCTYMREDLGKGFAAILVVQKVEDGA